MADPAALPPPSPIGRSLAVLQQLSAAQAGPLQPRQLQQIQSMLQAELRQAQLTAAHAQQLRQDCARAQLENESLRRQLAVLREELAKLNEEHAVISRTADQLVDDRITELLAQLQESEEARQGAEQAAAELLQHQAETQRVFSRLVDEHRNLLAEFERYKQVAIAQSPGRRADTERQLAEAHQRNQSMTTELKTAVERCKELEAQAADARAEVADVRRTRSERETQAIKERDTLHTELLQIHAQLKQYEHECAHLRKEVARLSAMNRAMQSPPRAPPEDGREPAASPQALPLRQSLLDRRSLPRYTGRELSPTPLSSSAAVAATPVPAGINGASHAYSAVDELLDKLRKTVADSPGDTSDLSRGFQPSSAPRGWKELSPRRTATPPDSLTVRPVSETQLPLTRPGHDRTGSNVTWTSHAPLARMTEALEQAKRIRKQYESGM